MGLKRDEYWTVEDKYGELYGMGGGYYSANLLCDLKRDAKEFCDMEGDRPVKVKIVRVG